MTGPYIDAPSEIIIPRLDDYEGLKLAADWIRDLESSDSRIHKEKVIEKAYMASKLGSANAQCFLFNCYLAYNPYYIYNVKQVPETEGLVDMPNPWPKFWALLEALRTRSISGHAARRTIEQTAELFDSEEWNGLCRRELIKDLRCGISEKTLNKVLKNSEWKIPVFSCQLATDSDDHPGKMVGRKRLEVKLDGVRVLAVVGAATVLYSRNGKVFENFPQVAEAINRISHKLRTGYGASGRFVLDGEIVGESFQQLMRQAHRKSDAQTDGMIYNIFDIIPLDDFERGWWNAQQLKRTNWLTKMKPVFGSIPTPDEFSELRIIGSFTPTDCFTQVRSQVPQEDFTPSSVSPSQSLSILSQTSGDGVISPIQDCQIPALHA